MKRTTFTFLTLLSFVFILILPLFLGLHAHMMPHHDMSAGDCIEHCLSGQVDISNPKQISLGNYLEVIVSVILSTQTFPFVIPLILLYKKLSHAPPNMHANIKNYNYCSLVGIIRLTT